MDLSFVESKKGKKKLCLDGYLYITDKSVSNKIYWKCEMSKKRKCSARVITVDDSIMKQSGSHNHAGNASGIEAAKVIEKVKEHATNSRDTPQYIVSCASAEVSGAAAVKLPSVENMKRTIRNIRAKKNVGYALPNSSLDLDIPDKFTKTNKGDLFLIYDSGPTNDRILIFATEKNLDILVQSEHWYADGTFKTVPSIFYQLYTIHGVKSGKVMPLVYALLPNKIEETYRKFLVALKEKIPNFQPLTIMIDFELAMVKAIEHEFPMSKCRGCFFHFCQSIYRKIQGSGLKAMYDTNAEFALKARLLSALAFIPVHNVVATFESLTENVIFPDEFQGVIDYFEDTWIGRPYRHNRRRAPIFKHEMWNCFDYVKEGMPKTNNAIEGWHCSFQHQLSACHPSIWKFIDALKREQSLQEMQIEQFVGGVNQAGSRKKIQRLCTKIAKYCILL